MAKPQTIQELINKLEKSPDWLKIPFVFMLDKRLRLIDGYVYGLIYWYTRMYLKKCILKDESIAQILGTGTSTIKNSLSRLDKGGYIIRIHDEFGNRKEIKPLLTDKDNTIALLNSQIGDGGDLQMEMGKSPNGDDNNNNYKDYPNSKELEVGDSLKGESPSPFNLQHETEKLQNDKRKHIQLIGAYIEERGLQPRNKYQLQQIILRHTKAAAKVAKFDEDQIQKAYKIANKEYDAWTLETLLKVLSRDKI